MTAAVLWDMDGTLVDTEPAWFAAEYALAARAGGHWDDDLARSLIGRDLLTSAGILREHLGLAEPAEDIVEELLDHVVASVAEAAPWRPGAEALLRGLRTAGTPVALVTMSYRRLVDRVLEALDVEFDAIVTGDVVEHGKPHPEPYLRAAAALGVDPADCLAIEDSETGSRSAEAAGCVVLSVPAHAPVRPGERRVLRTTLTGLDPAALRSLHGQVRRAARDATPSGSTAS